MSDSTRDDDPPQDRTEPPSLLEDASEADLDDVVQRNLDGLVQTLTGGDAATRRPLQQRVLVQGLAALGAARERARRRGADTGEPVTQTLAGFVRKLGAAASERGQHALARMLSAVHAPTFDARDLHHRLLAWSGREVLVAGHPMLFFEQGRLTSTAKLHVDPDIDATRPALVLGTLEVPDLTPLQRRDVVVVRGRISGALHEHLALDDCTRVDVLDTLPPPSEALSLDTLDPTRPLRADDLHRATERALVGQWVRVRGWLAPDDDRSANHFDLHDLADGRACVVVELTEPPTQPRGPEHPCLVRGRIRASLDGKVVIAEAELLPLEEVRHG